MGFHVFEEIELLVLRVLDHVCVTIVGELGRPLHARAVVHSASKQLDLLLNTRCLRLWFSTDEVEADAVVLVTYLSDSDAPATSVVVVDGDVGSDKTRLPVKELG